MTESLLPPNATALERDIEQATSRAVDAEIDTLWDADRIPEHLLPWLAWAVGVRQWSPEWSEVRKRKAVKSALGIRRYAGTKGAMNSVLEAHGIEHGSIKEWFDYGGQPGCFRLELNVDGIGLSARAYQQLFDGLNQAKRLSAHFDPAKVSMATRGKGHVGIGRHASGFITLTPHRSTHIETRGHFRTSTGQQASTSITLTPPIALRLQASGSFHHGIGQHSSGNTTLFPA